MKKELNSAEDFKMLGNQFFYAENYEKAIENYTLAIEKDN